MRGEEFGIQMRAHLARVEDRNADVLARVVEGLLRTVRDDGLVYTAGSGHSLALVLETFYRAGGLACVYPVFHQGLLPLAGGLASTVLERVSGLADALLDGAGPRERDLAVIFSNSGINPVPVELARRFRASGTPVVAVVSVAHMGTAQSRADAKLGDLADEVIDTLVPPGDAGHPAGTAPLSSLTSVFCWNLLLAGLVERAAAAGVAVPFWTSANVAGGDARNAELFARYRSRVPLL